MLFKALADAAEDSSKLGAQAIGVAHRAHNGLLDATGVNSIIPAPVKELTDGLYHRNEKLVLDAGHKGAQFLRNIDESLTSLQQASGLSQQHQEHELPEDHEDLERDSGDCPGLAPDDKGPFPDNPDSRDYQFELIAERPLGHYVDLRDHCPPVYNQKTMMSCTAHAVAGAFEFEVRKQGLPPFSPSRLFIWYNARAKSSDPHATKKNVGSSLRNAIRSLNFKAHGVCSESDWSYEVGRSDKKTHFFLHNAKAARRPPVVAEKHAHLHTASKYRSITTPNLQQKLIQCLDQGCPFVFGMKTYGLLSSNRIDSYGRGLRMPTAKDKKRGEHRHSLMAVGYIHEQEVFIVRNSWGVNWGQDGYFYMPYKYLLHCYDFWTISLVHNGRAYQSKGRR